MLDLECSAGRVARALDNRQDGGPDAVLDGLLDTELLFKLEGLKISLLLSFYSGSLSISQPS